MCACFDYNYNAWVPFPFKFIIRTRQRNYNYSNNGHSCAESKFIVDCFQGSSTARHGKARQGKAKQRRRRTASFIFSQTFQNPAIFFGSVHENLQIGLNLCLMKLVVASTLCPNTILGRERSLFFLSFIHSQVQAQAVRCSFSLSSCLLQRNSKALPPFASQVWKSSNRKI